MGRPKGSKNKPKVPAAATADAAGQEPLHGPGHNGGPPPLTDEQLQALTFQHKRKYVEALAAKKKADADLKVVCKLAKAECGNDAVDVIKDLIALETPEGEAELKAKIERQVRSAAWMGLPVGAQPGMFDVPDRTPAVDKAYADGKRDGLAGDPCRPKYAPGTPQYTRYMEGFNAGQAVLAGGIRKPDTPIEQAAAGGAERDDRPRFMQQRDADQARSESEAVDELVGGPTGTGVTAH